MGHELTLLGLTASVAFHAASRRFLHTDAIYGEYSSFLSFMASSCAGPALLPSEFP